MTYKYKGILGERDPDGFPKKGEDVEAWLLPRVRALFEDCGAKISTNNSWADVALTLAYRHVPGFDLGLGGRPKGAPRRDTQDDWAITREVDALVSKRKSIRSAASAVAAKRGEHDGGDKFEQRYRRTLKELGIRPGKVQDRLRSVRQK